MSQDPSSGSNQAIQGGLPRERRSVLVRVADSALFVSSVVAVVFLAYVGVRPSGVIAVAYGKWRANQRIAATLGLTWGQLEATSSRIDSAEGHAEVVEFSDYQCPYCKQQYFVFQRLMEESPTLRIAYRHTPNSKHPASKGAALAAICAERAGKFREMHRLLFETIQWQSDTNWVALGTQAGVTDTTAFKACLGSKDTEERLSEDVELAKRLEITGTPGLANHRRVIQGIVLPVTVTHLAGEK